MDLLSEILTHAGWQNDLLWSAALAGSWGYRFPCEKSGGLHIVTRGRCYVRFGGQDRPLPLEKGDVVFILRGVHHDLVSTPRGAALDISRLGEAGVRAGNQKREKQNGTTTDLISIRYEIPDRPRHPFFQELPDSIVLRSSDVPIADPIHTTIALIAREIEGGNPADLVVQRLTDVLLYYVLRRWVDSNPDAKSGWVAVFRDEVVLRVLDQIHRDPLREWTINCLAGSVGLSRASVAARFKKALGLTVMDYILRVRLEKGRALLAGTNYALEEIAGLVGYSSAFAFSKAYKRVYGESPRSTRQKSA